MTTDATVGDTKDGESLDDMERRPRGFFADQVSNKSEIGSVLNIVVREHLQFLRPLPRDRAGDLATDRRND